MTSKKDIQKKKNIAKKMINQMESGGYEEWLHKQHSIYIDNNLESYLDMNEPSNEKQSSSLNNQ